MFGREIVFSQREVYTRFVYLAKWGDMQSIADIMKLSAVIRHNSLPRREM